MIVTRSWLNEWIDLEGISTDELAKTLNSIGLEVDRLKEYRIPNKIVVGQVVECEKHPDADKLNVCKVDIGTSVRQIVCGASNVRAGLDVAVATIGAVMPSGMSIKPVKLRGVESHGMICSASELGLENCHQGILELDNSIGKYTIGQELLTLPTLNDDLIEIELTANRGDCLSIRGVSRDLSAAFDRPIKEKKQNEDEHKRVGIGRILSISHENNLNINLKYRAIDIKELTIPLMIKLRLAQIEETREMDLDALLLYVTHSNGVILRAYDYNFFIKDKKTIANIELKKDKNGFASVMSKKKASTIGIIQEDASKISKNDGIVILEASYIPPDIISKKMQEQKIESGPMYYRTSRGSEPDLEVGLDLCLNLVEVNSSSLFFGGTVELGDDYEDTIVSISKTSIDEFIGAKIDKIKIGKILRNLGFGTTKSSSENFVISVPRFRHDIGHKQDIVEEIVRLVGIDNIPSKPFIFKEESKLNDNYYSYKKRVEYRHKSAHSGFFETVSFVFDEKKVLQNYGFEVLDDSLEILNPIVNTLDTLRSTIMTGLLKATSLNVKNGRSSVKLFEVGSVFNSKREESLRMAFIFSGAVSQENLSNIGKPKKIDFAHFVQKISDIVGEFELKEFETTHKLSHPYQTAQIFQNNQSIGELFRVHPSVEEDYGLSDTFICEIEFNKLHYGLKKATPISKYQAVFRDLSIIMPQDMSYDKLKTVIQKSANDELIRFYPVDRYSDKELGKNISLSIRFVLQSFEKTLEEEDITSAMNLILEALKSELNIGLR